jgi:predicted dehydrogenase
MKIAVVGCGQFADAHIQEARKIPDVSVVAVCDSNIHMAHQAAARFGIRAHHTNLETMLRETRPDVVHITTPPSTHLPIGLASVRHGCHVYVEKPFVVHAGEAEELIDAAVKAGRLVCVGHSNAFDESFLRLKEKHRAGALGEVVHVDTYMGYDLAGGFGSVLMGDPGHWVHGLPGGLAQNNISHPLSLLLEFVRDEVPKIHARAYRRRKVRYGDVRDRLYDELRVSVDGKTTTGSLVFSSHARPAQLYTVVHGTRCQAIASLDSRTLRVVTGATLPGPFYKVQWAANFVREARREYRRHLFNLVRSRLHFFQGLNTLLTRFYAAIHGEGPMPVPMKEAYRTTVVMDEIFRQCGSHEAQDIEERVET